jgi:hypothetical protein
MVRYEVKMMDIDGIKYWVEDFGSIAEAENAHLAVSGADFPLPVGLFVSLLRLLLKDSCSQEKVQE